MTKHYPKDNLQAEFNRIDKNRHGVVRIQDLRQQLPLLDIGSKGPLLSEAQKDALIREADRNGDRFVDFPEFQNLVLSEASRKQKVLLRMADVVIAKDERTKTYSYLSHYRCCPPPLFMILISLAQVAFYIYYSIEDNIPAAWNDPGGKCPGCYQKTANGGRWRPGILVFVAGLKSEAWRYVSYMFIHASMEHILANIILQLILGVPLELVHKFWRVGPIYLGGVVYGALLHYFATQSNSLLVGASGGGYALIAAHLSNVIINWSEMEFAWMRLLIILVFVGFDVGHAVWRALASTACSRVSYMAHIGGAVAGLLFGILILHNIRKLEWERIIWWFALVAFILITTALIVCNVLVEPGGLKQIGFFNCTN